MTTPTCRLLAALLFTGLTAVETARAGEIPLGSALTRSDIAVTIAAGYDTPQRLDGTGGNGQPLFLAPEKADIFLAVDVRGGKGNRNGFGPGKFIPYLFVSYTLKGQGSGEVGQGRLHPLVDARGMRYGNNVSIPAPGTYSLTLTIEPPVKVGFGRHTDLETGVARWWKPVQVEWTLDHRGRRR